MFRCLRAVSESESLHLLEAGATRTVSDERESALRAAQVLLKDILARDVSQLDTLVYELRLRQEDLENDRFELAMLKKSGVVNSLRNDRIPQKDRPAKGAASFMQMLSRDLGDGFAPMFDDASKVFSNLWGNQQTGDEGGDSSTYDKKREALQEQRGERSPANNAENDSPTVDPILEEQDLGVLICTMPQKKSD